MEKRRDVEYDLKEGIREVNKVQLADALQRLAKMKAEVGDFCPSLEKEARTIVRQIEEEEQLAMKIKQLVDSSAVTGTPGRLNASKINTKELRSCIATASSSMKRTAMLKKAIRMGGVLCDLREAVKEALASDDAATSPLWARVRDALVAATGELGAVGKTSPELNLIQEDAAARAKIEEIADKIRFATQSLDEEWLAFGIDQATRLQMDTHSSVAIRECVEDAKKTLRMITETKVMLQEGIDTVDMAKLHSGLELASRFTFETEVVSEAQALHARCTDLIAQAQVALQRVIVDLMKNSIESCDRQRLRISELDKMRSLLMLPEPKLLQRQLKASVLLGEHDRVTELTVRIKELFFSQAGGMFTFSKYPNLKPRNLFAKRYGVHNETIKRSMLQWTNEPIHTSLTRLDGAGVDPAAKKHATRIFKNILGYMGDRQYSYPILLAQEVTRCGLECACEFGSFFVFLVHFLFFFGSFLRLALIVFLLSLCLCLSPPLSLPLSPAVRDEIYCQLVKQLIDNPGKASVSRGWNLMALCLSTFPPSDEFENFLELFLRTNHQERNVRKLHKIVYRGARAAPIAVEEIEQIQHRGSRFSIVLPNGADLQQYRETKGSR